VMMWTILVMRFWASQRSASTHTAPNSEHSFEDRLQLINMSFPRIAL
jgi:hypothetical protein